MRKFKDVRLESIVKRVKVGFVGSIDSFYCGKDGIQLLRTLNLTRNGVDFDDLKYVTKEFYEKNKKSQLHKDDLLIARHGDNGKACIYDSEDKAQALNVVIIEPDKQKCSPYLLKYLIDMPYVQKQIVGAVGGSVQGVINTTQIAELMLPFCDELNYNKIECLLKSIDDKIQVNFRKNTMLEQLAESLFEYYFWNKNNIQTTWREGTLSEIISVDKGGDWGNEEPDEKHTVKVFCIRGADFPALCGKDELTPPIRYIQEKNVGKKLNVGDLIIEISGGSPTQSTGRICYINEQSLRRFDGDIITSNFCKAISLVDKNYMYWFYMLWKKYYNKGIFFSYEGKTTGIKNLLFDVFCKDYPVVIPDRRSVEKYNDKVDVVFEQIQNNLNENQRLIRLKEYLLPMMFNGQITFNMEA